MFSISGGEPEDVWDDTITAIASRTVRAVRAVQYIDVDATFDANVEESVSIPNTLADTARTSILWVHVAAGINTITRVRLISTTAIGITLTAGAPTTYRVTACLIEWY